MHVALFDTYRRMFDQFPPSGEVLEIGAKPDPRRSLAALLPDCSRTVINLTVPRDTSRMPDVRFLKGDSNEMSELFDDDSFDVVLSNAVMEHDGRFWMS